MRRTILLASLAMLGACAERGGPAEEPNAPAARSVIVQDRFIVSRSAYGHQATLTRLYEALDRRELTVFAVIDHAAAAQGVGAELAPMTLVIFGDPEAGTPLLQDVPLTGLELPLKALVYEEDGEVYVAVTGVANLERSYPLEREARILDRMDRLLKAIKAEVTGG
jgi:uncharacterized protein (DUF302 family)